VDRARRRVPPEAPRAACEVSETASSREKRHHDHPPQVDEGCQARDGRQVHGRERARPPPRPGPASTRPRPKQARSAHVGPARHSLDHGLQGAHRLRCERALCEPRRVGNDGEEPGLAQRPREALDVWFVPSRRRRPVQKHDGRVAPGARGHRYRRRHPRHPDVANRGRIGEDARVRDHRRVQLTASTTSPRHCASTHPRSPMTSVQIASSTSANAGQRRRTRPLLMGRRYRSAPVRAGGWDADRRGRRMPSMFAPRRVTWCSASWSAHPRAAPRESPRALAPGHHGGAESIV
jgi:hypothetical protein